MEPLSGDDPRVMGGYRLLGRLGAGGMGRVYLGRSAGGRTVAVKVVHAHYAVDDQFRARFQREIESARRVGGAWTAPVLDADPDAAVPWVATGYVAGPSLAQAVTEYGPLAERSVRVLGAGLAEALAAVHALDLVHRDVKPSNVLLTLDGPVLIDFGIARATEGTASLTTTGVSVGSPGYMAPEQILGKDAAGAADVFSLGTVLAYAATGTSPFPGDSSASLLYKVVHEEPELGPQLEGELRELVTRCLSKNPADRPAPADLAARLTGEGSGAADLVRAGWLPGPLVERVSRRAVELLNLDLNVDAGAGGAAAAGAAGAGAAGSGGAGAGAFEAGEAGTGEAGAGEAGSGLVPFDLPAQGPGAGYPGGTHLPTAPDLAGLPTDTGHGTRGGTGSGRVGGTGGGTGGSGDSGAGSGTGGGTGGPIPGQPGAQPVPQPVPEPLAPPLAPPFAPPLSPPVAQSVPKERRVALTGAVGGKDPDRPRRVSCTLVLTVAGAVAAATTAAFVFTLLPKAGSNAAGGGDQAGAKPPATGHTPSGRPADPGGYDGPLTVAKPFLGTWTGSITTSHGIPNGTMTSTITAGGKGDYVIHTTYDAVLVRCEAKAKLESATDRRLILLERPDGKQGPGCTGNKSRVTYTLAKDGTTIAFTSDDPGGGTPKATLTKK
ncbi:MULTISPECIES: serine/threonine-protein kinase [Streptomyces]|uniref:Serine/threonine protein kinase n=1 Tax=Streptomyces siderophoricus TaxID=2802281 RepID=A0ABS1N2I6_9ACTN|nr:serine/threonine-protein kinase [Streptomyces sp. 9-7]MBL1094165.1 serine/threonine protein kinase [Streptomyces sp. 9-7]